MISGTAYHEAAHAVSHVVLGYALHEVSADSEIEDKLGHTHGEVLTESLKQARNWSAAAITEHDRQVARDDTIILLAGEIAEARYEGNAYFFEPDEPPTSSDRQEVLGRIARMEPSDYAGQNALLEELISVAADLVNDNWERITRVAEALAASKALDGSAVKQLLSDAASDRPEQPDRDD